LNFTNNSGPKLAFINGSALLSEKSFGKVLWVLKVEGSMFKNL